MAVRHDGTNTSKTGATAAWIRSSEQKTAGQTTGTTRKPAPEQPREPPEPRFSTAFLPNRSQNLFAVDLRALTLESHHPWHRKITVGIVPLGRSSRNVDSRDKSAQSHRLQRIEWNDSGGDSRKLDTGPTERHGNSLFRRKIGQPWRSLRLRPLMRYHPA